MATIETDSEPAKHSGAPRGAFASSEDEPMRRVLIIAAYFLPRRRVGSMPPFRLGAHLREVGWGPTVLISAARGLRRRRKAERLLHHVHVSEMSSPMDRTRKSEGGLVGGKLGGGRSRRRL